LHFLPMIRLSSWRRRAGAPIAPEAPMKLAVLALSVGLLTGLAVSSTAQAFTQEPVSPAVGGGSALVDPADANRTMAAPRAPAQRLPGIDDGRSSPEEAGPDPRLAAPPQRPGSDNRNLFWNNSSRYWR
jgi:hypothetical protein